MRSLPKILLISLGCTIAMVAIVTTVVMSVQYHPEGVKPHQREAYAEKLEQIEDLNRMAADVASEAKPIAVFEETSFDFGMVDPHTTLTHNFVVKNGGELPLQLNVTGTSCKCTMGDLENDTLLPGEETNITMTWNTGYQAEEYEQTAEIATSDPLRSSIKLEVKGQVKAQFVAPQRVAFRTTDLGVQTEASFVVYSQLWEDFTITDVKCDVPGFEWIAQPESIDSVELADAEAASAWGIRLFAAPLDFGDYDANVIVTAEPNDGGEAVVRELACLGKVRKPINFYHPGIHKSLGLDIGTLNAGEEHQFHLVVRARTDVDRPIEVLDVEPKELQTRLEPLEAAGSYRLTLTIPPDCPMLVFNANTKHGYVQVGDPTNKKFSNWFPLMGAVVTLDQ